MTLIEKKVEKSLEVVGSGKDFLNRTPITQGLRLRINNWDHETEKGKDTIILTKWQSTDWETIVTDSTSDRELISKINKDL